MGDRYPGVGREELFWGTEGERCSRVGMGRGHLEWGEVFWGGEWRVVLQCGGAEVV